MKRKFADIFLIVFPLTGIMFGVLVYFLWNLKAQGLHGLTTAAALGTGCGLVFGCFVGFFVRSMHYQFAIDPSVDISTRLHLMLHSMGYRPDSQMQKILLFSPTVRSGIFADRIRIEINAGQVTIEGPHSHVEKIRDTLAV